MYISLRRARRFSLSVVLGLLTLFLGAAMLVGPEDAFGQGLVGSWRGQLPEGDVMELRINPDGTLFFEGD